MPGKTAKSAPLPPFGLSGMTALVRADTLSCENAGKSQKCTQDRESSGESRLKEVKRERKLLSSWTLKSVPHFALGFDTYTKHTYRTQ
jgi:hypothetical protein